MRTDNAAWLVCSLLCGCATVAPQKTTALAAVPVNAVAEAPMRRAAADAPGSYWRRVWAPEFETLIQPLRASVAGPSLPPELNGQAVARWQTMLNEGWKTTDPDPVLAATTAVIAQAAPLRDQLALLAALQQSNAQVHSAAVGIQSILSEIVQEADLLALRDSGQTASFEEFIARYPDGPYTASVLFALGALHEGRRDLGDAKDAFRRQVERFPNHPLSAHAREKLKELR